MSDAADQSRARAVQVDFVALAAGQMIGRYEVVSVLGQGGFGITYRAYDSQLGRDVAVKEYLPLALAVRQGGTTVLPRSTDAAEDFSWGRDRFVEEGRTLATLQHAPAIVRVYDFLEANGTAYIVMELLGGQTLERRLKDRGPLAPSEVDRITWPLLDGLERVHGVGFLHRDIKPANVLLDIAGNPTLIDFGASRSAVADRTTAMTAVFTPGYAAAEQMTSAKQGPWTDIYGLSATLYHTITGEAPPSAFDRMLDDGYEPLGRKALPGFSRGLLAGLDAGLALRASDRPQSIAGWRSILVQASAPRADATVAMGAAMSASSVVQSAMPMPPAKTPVKKRGVGLWIGAVAAAVIASVGGYYALIGERSTWPKIANVPAVPPPATATENARLAAEAQRLKDQEELTRLRAEAAAHERAEQEAAQRRQIEDEARRKIEAEMAEKQRLDEEVREKAQAEAAARRKAEQDEQKAAEAAEGALHLTAVDRQHVQVALTALGFDTGGTDGSFGTRTRDMLTSWQKTHGSPATGFLTGAQNQALLKEAAPAVSRFDEEQRRREEAKRKADEERVKSEAVAKAAPTPARPMPPLTGNASTPSRSGPDGMWRGTMHCTPSRSGGEFAVPLQIAVVGGAGTWTRPGSGPGSTGTQTINVRFSGANVVVSRVFIPNSQPGVLHTATMPARSDGNTVSGSGPEANGGGRSCTISLTRAP